MVDDPTFGRVAWIRADGQPGKRAMRKAALEYLFAGRTKMLFDCLTPVVAFPMIGFIIQATATFLPWLDTFERWGPFGIVAGWLMWRESRQQKLTEKMITALERRSDKQAEVMHGIAETLIRMEKRPCLYQIEMGERIEDGD